MYARNTMYRERGGGNTASMIQIELQKKKGYRDKRKQSEYQERMNETHPDKEKYIYFIITLYLIVYNDPLHNS